MSVFCFKQKTAYEMRISDWSSDVCSSDLLYADELGERGYLNRPAELGAHPAALRENGADLVAETGRLELGHKVAHHAAGDLVVEDGGVEILWPAPWFSGLFREGIEIAGDLVDQRVVEIHRVDRKSTRLNSSLMRISYAVFCLKKKKKQH